MSKEPIYIERTFNVSAEEIWNALTNRDAMKEWYFDIPDFELTEGKSFSFYESGGDKKFLHTGEILEVKPLELLKYTWKHPEQSNGTSYVTWQLVPRRDATMVKLTHEDVDRFADAGPEFARENYETGWSEILGKSLYNFLIK